MGMHSSVLRKWMSAVLSGKNLGIVSLLGLCNCLEVALLFFCVIIWSGESGRSKDNPVFSEQEWDLQAVFHVNSS